MRVCLGGYEEGRNGVADCVITPPNARILAFQQVISLRITFGAAQAPHQRDCFVLKTHLPNLANQVFQQCNTQQRKYTQTRMTNSYASHHRFFACHFNLPGFSWLRLK